MKPDHVFVAGAQTAAILRTDRMNSLHISNTLPQEVYVRDGKVHVHLPGVVIVYDCNKYMDYYRELPENKE